MADRDGTDIGKLSGQVLYQVGARCWMTALSKSLGRPATLDDIPDAELDRLAGLGFDWVWMLSVWQTGSAGPRIVRANEAWCNELRQILPDLSDDDIAASGFAITAYSVNPSLGGDAALVRLRERLNTRNLRLMLDFVPNHMALEHPWVEDHPEYFVNGSDADLAHWPENYTKIERAGGPVILAHGRDPNFAGWTDTLQLDYSNPATQAAMVAELLSIASRCDGVRCDMAMLPLPEVFQRTWGRTAPPFWPAATGAVRERFPQFRFVAEAYWDLEWTLQQQGFDGTYDKRLYDRLREGHAGPVRGLENHDEPRAAAVFPPGMHEAAAVVAYLSPGLRFFQQGQIEGRRTHLPPQLIRAPNEPIDEARQQFYEKLLSVLRQPVVRDGFWRLLECVPVAEGEQTSDRIIAWSWEDGEERRLLAINYAATASRCHVRLPFERLHGRMVRLRDLIEAVTYERDGAALAVHGLYVELPPWGRYVFEVTFH
jgi:Alpha amylase, catalytic domain